MMTAQLTRQERKATALVDRWFVRELAPADWRFLRQTMRTSRHVREHYDRVAELRNHVRPKEVMGDDRLLAIREALLEPERAESTQLSWRWIWSVSATCAIFAALLFVHTSGHDGEFQTRDAARGDVGVRAFCVDATDGKERVHHVATIDDAQPTTCSLSDTLQLSYSMRSTVNERYLFLVGVDDQHRALWYFPTPDERASMSVAPTDGGEHVLPDSVALQINHRPGKLTIYGIFTPAPVTVEAVKAWIERAPLGSLPAAADVGAKSATVKKLTLVLTP